MAVGLVHRMSKVFPAVFYREDNFHEECFNNWKKEVEDPFKSYGLICTVDNERSRMVVDLEDRQDTRGSEYLEHGYYALYTLGAGLHPKWVEYIVDGSIQVSLMPMIRYPFLCKSI